ncbi:unnamed protein product [Tuber melanosporum]|uniref:Histone acetyltransferase n=1 Tax=Tuber melanosporum (strain Mel28) TaxID=656061 RepID=D5GPU9_TUBMM|nr:uncharacterized protein GSTUM_00012042001 [Tuber melanosporum]CAZ86542.1 unnamed protein product [Tuber melanosporum]
MEGLRGGEGEDDSDIESVASTRSRRSTCSIGRRKRGDLDPRGAEEDEETEDQSSADDRSPSESSSAVSSSSDDDDDEYGEDDEEEEEWQADKNGEPWQGVEDEDAEKPTKNLCIHCDKDEDNDPSPEYEDPLECICGSFAHKQCDREANECGGVKSAFDEETSKWRCPSCAAGGHEPVSSQKGLSSQSKHYRRPNTAKETPRLRERKRKRDDSNEDAINSRRRKRGKFDLPKKKYGNTSEDEDGEFELEPEDEHRMEISHDEEQDAVSTSSDIQDTPPKGKQRLYEPRTPVVTYKKTARKFHLHITNLTPGKLATVLATISNPNLIQPKPKSIPSGPKTEVHKPEKLPARRGRPLKSATARAPPKTHIPKPVFHNFSPQDNEKSKPYGGILTEEEASTELTLPGAEERDRFEKARAEAEAEKETRLVISASLNPQPKQKNRDRNTRFADASKIECIHFGEYEIDTWYTAPYPQEYSENRVLWICEFCLKYMNSEYVGWRHKMKCESKHPPGDEVYRDGSISVFEIDGRKHSLYCQNLCVLAKLFLGSKTLYYDVEPFLFYVMTECNEFGMHFVGYFSKEKRISSQHNVSCILTLPIHQRKGYGNLLIAFSYLLTRHENKTGSPEKPFSDLGLLSYRNYWKLTLCYELRSQSAPVTIVQLSQRTGMTPDDVVCGLEALNALVRDPVTGTYALRIDYPALEAHIQKWEAKGYVKLNPDALVWTPYVVGRSQAVQLNEPLPTIAPRPEPAALSNIGEDRGGNAIGDQGRNGSRSLTGDAMDMDKIVPTLHTFDLKVPETPFTPFAPLRATPLAMKFASPSKWNSQMKSFMQDDNTDDIPPTRFEIVPPPPGSYTKKMRAGSSVPRGRTPGTKNRRGRKTLDTPNGFSSGKARGEGTRDFHGSPSSSAGPHQEGDQEGVPSGVDPGMRPGPSLVVASEV